MRGLRSGLPVTETLAVVAQEVSGPVGEEFKAIVERIKIGRTMEEALQATADRLGIPEFNFFCITLAIQRETGGNLAETLSNLADVLRKRAQMKLKIRAMSSESKASAYIVGALPFIVFIMIWWINPEYIGGFFTEDRLIVAGLGGMVWMGIGSSSWPRWSVSKSEGRRARNGFARRPHASRLRRHHGRVDPCRDRRFRRDLRDLHRSDDQGSDGHAGSRRSTSAATSSRRASSPTTPRKRQSLVRKTDTTDKVKDTLDSMKVLQQSQIEDIQQKLAHAGYRNKELAVLIIGMRLAVPIAPWAGWLSSTSI